LIIDKRSAVRQGPLPLSRQPAHRRGEGRAGRQAELRIAAGRLEELSSAPTGHQHRLGYRLWTSGPNPGIGHPWWANYFPANPGRARESVLPGYRAAGGSAPSRTRGRRPTARRSTDRTGTRYTRRRPAHHPHHPRHRRPSRHHLPGRGAAAPTRTRSATGTTGRRRTDRNVAMRDNLRATVWRLAVFVGFCLVGALALVMVFAQLRVEGGEEKLQGRIHHRLGTVRGQLRAHRWRGSRQGQAHFHQRRRQRRGSSSGSTTRWC